MDPLSAEAQLSMPRHPHDNATTGEETPEAEAPTTLSGASIYGMTTAFAVAVMSAAWYVL